MSVSAGRQAEIQAVVDVVPNLTTSRITVTNAEEKTDAETRLGTATKANPSVAIDADQVAVVWRAVATGPASVSVDTLTRQLNLAEARVHDAPMTLIPTTAANDDLGLTAGTFGTASPRIVGADFGGTTEDKYTRFVGVDLPEDFRAGMGLTLRVRAGMAVVSDGTCTLDVLAFRNDGDATVTGDLYAGAAVTINSATLSNEDFVLDTTALVPGDTLDIKLRVQGSDTGNAAANINALIDLVELRAV
jgi:hypothetical protein